MQTYSDRELLQRWNGGDSTAGSILFQRHIKPLRRFFRRRLNDDADDLVQETLLACVESARAFRAEATVATFLGSIARHKLFTAYRSRGRERAVAEGLADFLGCEPTAEPAYALDRRSLENAMTRLPEPLRTVLVLTYWNGLAQDDVARELGIPAGTVASRVRRAKMALSRSLSGGD